MDNERATIGNNNPPTPMEEWADLHSGLLGELENWCNGELVSNESQMKSVDDLLKQIKTYRSGLKGKVDEYRRPFIDANAASLEVGKRYTADADKMQSALLAIVSPFKAKLAEEKASAEKAAWEEKNRREREAREAEQKAQAGNIDDMREAEAAKQAVIDADKAAKSVKKSAPKGFRTVHHHEIEDGKALINWIAKNDKQAMADFMAEYARKNFRKADLAGVKTWETKEPF